MTDTPNNGPSVIVEGVGKLYRLYPDPRARLKELLFLGKKKFHSEKWALRDINFELWPGQALGVIGVNGAGKSTLLKILTGTSRQDEGRFEMNGTVSSMLELGAGFHPEFTGRENIFMNAAVQGIPRALVKERYEEIAAFSELGEFLERPVRTYSSGMAMRLGFAASMLVNPDILILDEVLAVGDAHFQKKCMDKFAEYRSADKTILFVSHSVYHIREICDRAIWIHEGKMVMDGDPIEVTDEYENILLQMQADYALRREGPEGELVRGLAAIESVTLHLGNGAEPRGDFKTGDDLCLRFRYVNPEEGEPVYPMIAVLRNDGTLVFASRPERPLVTSTESQEVRMRIPDLRLLAGQYEVAAYITDKSAAHFIDQRQGAVRFKVTHQGLHKGIYLADTRWEVPERAGRDGR